MICHIVHAGHAEVPCQGLGVGNHGIPASSYMDAEEDDDNKCNAHNYALNQVCGGNSQETA